jgi:hypothetical protein
MQPHRQLARQRLFLLASFGNYIVDKITSRATIEAWRPLNRKRFKKLFYTSPMPSTAATTL